jgi:NAD-dependent dihydropyrimidine dehydrogenase PreA subunit
MRTKAAEAIRTAVGTLFRLLPLPAEPGLRVFGHPDGRSPVFVTANFDLTEKRVATYLRNLDCYLLVAPTRGINVWCAAKGGNFTANSIVSVVKTSRISDMVTNRTLILPQLSAPGIDTRSVRKETGWRCKFGPVYAKDIPQYVASGFKKTEAMRRVKWDLADRLDIGIGVSFPMFLLILVILALFLRAWLAEFVVLGWGLLLLIYGLYPLIPGRTGWRKLLFLEASLAVGLLGYSLLATTQSWYIRDLFFMAMGLVMVIGIDFGGGSPFYKSDLDPLLDKVGIRRFWSVGFKGRSGIKGEQLTLDQARCTACGICYDVCPRGVYAIERDGHKRVMVKYEERCEACEACVLQCPREAISLAT